MNGKILCVVFFATEIPCMCALLEHLFPGVVSQPLAGHPHTYTHSHTTMNNSLTLRPLYMRGGIWSEWSCF